MGDELKWLSKGGEGIIKSVVKIPTPHMQLVEPYLCAHVVILHWFLCHVLAS